MTESPIEAQLPLQSPRPITPSVSVALCTYNGARFLTEQLRSIESQTLQVQEVVICDDGSTDRTLEIIAHSRLPIKLVINSTGLGVTKNFEKAISLCTGEIIFLCDQDDVWMPAKVQTLVDHLHGRPALLVFSNAMAVDESLKSLGYRMWDSIWFDREEQERVRAGNALPVLLRHAVAAGSTMAFKSKYRPLLLPIPDLPNSHDIWITLLLACIGEIDLVDIDLIQYRLHGANQVGMQRYGLFDQIRMAKQQVETHAFEYLFSLHKLAYERLTAQAKWPVHPNLLVMVQDKIIHSRKRDLMSGNVLRRLPGVVGELLKGNYRRFSYGYKSVLQDLFLR